MKEWDFVKLFLIASLILCLSGLGIYVYQVKDLDSLKKQIPLSRIKLKEIGELYANWNVLKAEERRDKRQGVMLGTYLEDQGHRAGVKYGRLRVDTQTSNPNNRLGYVDQPHTISAGKVKFRRENIARYIYNIEQNTNRLKVTELSLDKPASNFEEWNMTMKLVERNPLEKK